MRIVASDTFLPDVMLPDVLLSHGFFLSGMMDIVTICAEFPGARFDQLLRFGIFDMLITGTMATLARQVAVVTFTFHGNNRVMAGDTALVPGVADWKRGDFIQ
jgi:hypothetical protein